MATAKKKPAPESPPTFESALSEIEGIARQLESDDLSLEEMLLRFEDGVKLLRFCDARLRDARGKLLELVDGDDGELVAKVLGDSLETFIGGEEG